MYGRVQIITLSEMQNSIYHISFNLNIPSIKHLKQLETRNVIDIHRHHEICIPKHYRRKMMHDTVLCFLIFSKFLLCE